MCRSSKIDTQIRIQVMQHCYQHPRVAHHHLLYFPERLLVRSEGKGEGFALLVEGNVRAFAFTTLGTGLSLWRLLSVLLRYWRM